MRHHRSLPALLIAALPLAGWIPAPWQADPPEAAELTAQAALAELIATLELGLQARTIELGRPLVADGGQLAGDGRAVATVARALFQAGLEAEADQLLAGAKPSEGTAPIVALERAWIAIQRDELDTARGILLDPAGGATPLRYPDYPTAWLMLARVLARDGRLDQAAAFAQRFTELAPLHEEVASAWHLLSREAAQRGDGERARLCLDRSSQMRQWHDVMRVRRLQVRQSPTDPLPRLGLALGWMQVEGWERADRELRELLAITPDYCRALFHLGEVARLSNRPDDAIAAYGRCIECDPDDMRPRFNRALLHRAADRDAQALADLEQIVASPAADDPLFLGAHLELARLHRDGGRADEAAGAYEQYRARGGTEEL